MTLIFVPASLEENNIFETMTDFGNINNFKDITEAKLNPIQTHSTEGHSFNSIFELDGSKIDVDNINNFRNIIKTKFNSIQTQSADLGSDSIFELDDDDISDSSSSYFNDGNSGFDDDSR